MKNQPKASAPAVGAQHTLRPWQHKPGSKYVTANGVPVAELIAIGGQFFSADNSTPEEIAANGRLIAAAPDLLAALEHLVFLRDATTAATERRWAEGIVSARAAIAKAKATP